MTDPISRRRILTLGGQALTAAALGATLGATLRPRDSLAIDWGSLFGRRREPGAPGRVKLAEGEVHAGGRRLAVGDAVGSGETVRVSRRGRAVISLPDNTVFTLSGGSILDLVFEHMKQSILRLISGSLLAAVPAGGDRMLVMGPLATIGVKGTVFYRQVFGEEDRTARTMDGTINVPLGTKDYFCTCFGETEYMKPKASEPFFTSRATHHDAYFMDPSQPGLIQQAPMVNHFDPEIRDLVVNFQDGPKHDLRWLKL
ncbi:MAG: FecR domain-containing protein [Candidatus Lambdaproteobacteria bacterium]|nr:FecR domain-containing protein [Candidatus Lambdaproteobacteria bacterium]